MKKCSKCGGFKPPSCFYKRRNRPSGLTPWCGDCLRALRMKNHAAKADDEVYKEKARQRAIASRWARIDSVREYDRERYRADPAPAKARAVARRARVKGATVEPVSRTYVYERDGGRCHICGLHVTADNFHLDHLIPISKGGDHSHTNVRVAHPLCNARRLDGRLPAQLLLLG